ncbi:aminoglycoside O-phosphotransferase APH(2'')-IIIa [Fischerella thermalis CCMEE 5273]|nr:aminoglycoside O-phosphotransferase APH(2'')-IIIa [Fischerella thermalis CCMEE 5273]
MKEYKEAIWEHFPDFELTSVTKLGEGWMSVALLVNERWVFRFPKKEQGAQDLQKEINIMPRLSKRLSITIPHFEFIGQLQNGYPFVGYKVLPGEILDEDGFALLSTAEKRNLARQLAAFMDEIHSFSVDEALGLGVPVVKLAPVFAQLQTQVEQRVFPLTDVLVQQYISTRFQTYFDHGHYRAYTPRLIHGDLSPDHFLINPQNQQLTGIIDFGDLQVTDPDYEYRYLLEDCGLAFTKDVLQCRGERDVDGRLKKISLFVTFDHLDYLLEGMKRGEDDWVREGLEVIENEMKSFGYV